MTLLIGRKMSDKLERDISRALDLKSLRFPPDYHVVGVRWEPMEDSTGEESLDVSVLFDDNATDKQIGGSPASEISNAIRTNLEMKGVRLFPYISFMRKREYDAIHGQS